MKSESIEITVLKAGERPHCVAVGPQCRGCFGWSNMLAAAQTSALWRRYPLHCATTGLTVQVRRHRGRGPATG